MGMSSQRLLIMVIAINLVLSIGFTAYESPRQINYETVGETVYLGNDMAESLEGESASITPDNAQEEGTWGNSLRIGGKIVGIFLRGMVALPYSQETNNDPLTRIFLSMITLIRILMYMLLIMEVYFIIKNRKNT